MAFPHGIAGSGATRRGGRHGRAHAEPPLCRTGHTEGPGRSRPRPGDPDRHRRSAGRGPTPSRPATCGTRVPHTRARFPCTSTPMSFSHLRIGNELPRTALKSGLRTGGSNATPNGRRSCLREGSIRAEPASQRGGEGGSCSASACQTARPPVRQLQLAHRSKSSIVQPHGDATEPTCRCSHANDPQGSETAPR